MILGLTTDELLDIQDGKVSRNGREISVRHKLLQSLRLYCSSSPRESVPEPQESSKNRIPSMDQVQRAIPYLVASDAMMTSDRETETPSFLLTDVAVAREPANGSLKGDAMPSSADSIMSWNPHLRTDTEGRGGGIDL